MIEPYKSQEFCKKYESVSMPKFNNGFFDLCKDLGSTKNIVVGHDHLNCFSIDYQDITLTYSMKTGVGCYSIVDLIGGTTFTFDSQGKTTIKHEFVDIAKYMEE